MTWKKLYLFIVILMPTVLVGQKNAKRQAEDFFDHGKYMVALSYYERLPSIEVDAQTLFRRGRCYFETNDLDRAQRDISNAIQKGYGDPSAYLYLGRIHHARNELKAATEDYKNFLRRSGSDDVRRKQVRNLIKRCGMGLKLKFAPQSAFVENMGRSVNSVYDEYNAIQSPNYIDKFYFTSNREGSTGGLRDANGLKDEVFGSYFADMYSMESQEGVWSDIRPANPLLNSPRHDVVLDFSSDGSIMLFYKSLDLESGEIYADTFRVDEKSGLYPSKLISPVVGELGDRHLNFFNDSTVIFASKRKEGFGGYDLYITAKRQGYWSDPVNLGPEVNSPYDEVSPYLTNDGTTLYYSSNSLQSVGGYDIMQSKFLYKTKRWSEPKNMGFPVNSSEDDLFFRVSIDGRSATFSSKRKDGFGGFDLYIAYLKDQETGQLTYTPELPFLLFTQTDSIDIAVLDTAVEDLPIEDTEEVENDVREYVIEPLYYGNDDVILNPQNTQKIRNLADLLTIFPQARLELISHSIEEGLPAYELYFSIKRAEQVADEIRKAGIAADRIILKGCGSNYPVVKDAQDGGNRRMADRMNRRINILVHNVEDAPIQIQYEQAEIVDYLQDRRYDLFQTVIDGLSYKVQIAEVHQMYQNEIIKAYNDAMIEKNESKQTYLYTVGLYNDFASARRLKEDLIQYGIHEARIIPYVNGLRIDRSQYVDYSSAYPDLLNFLQYQHE